ncbi:PKD domain-containing protein [Dissulfurirhabdus thermomarina]|uniref:PKD domain-containing protein n=1 Tax=Dissulfurirhabdus thermomarina TaxID=1765737 RepID=A0A6N9TJJ0_DISTH|nr:PKD domain-containing protein [Dissulfurirhabdus thermomarina]NDY41421.1 PKD domain-containing protein [Dissulfurirhabdus thermomarina]NMX24409.1 PKD domain-containing protein [Dissulfurirhabdus thermomarina]
MARLFLDGAGSSYNATTATYLDNPFTTMTPYDYGSLLEFQRRVDNSIPGQMRDCGECHAGGGAMEYVPAPTPGARVPLRDIATADVNGAGPITAANVTAFNYYVDIYDDDGDGNRSEVLYNDFTQTGVLEFDCLLCHLEGYDWEARKEAVRHGNFDASRTVGAGLGILAGTNGRSVVYDPSLVEDNGTVLKLGLSVAARIMPTPPTANCASCHFDAHQVDWKKRGDVWAGNALNEVHLSIGCMGCHKRKDEDFSNVGTDGAPSSTLLGQCDPAKGDAPYSSLWNKTDNTVKTCADCHLRGGDGGQSFAAPNPANAHAAAGLTAKVCQDGTDGVADASHIDIIACSACHVRKLNLGGPFTGGALVDATGPDAEGRLADHENPYVTRTMERNVAVSWYKGRLVASNILTTLFWRDKNDVDFDANRDGRAGGMDALLPTHVRTIDEIYGVGPVTEDGNVSGAELDQRIAQIDAEIEALTGVSGAAKITRLSFMAVPFRVNHNVSPAWAAWGAGGCGDCHAPGAGFYNGAYRLKGEGLEVSFGGQVTPFTKANAFTDPTDFHPNLKDKAGVRSIPVKAAFQQGTLRDVDRSELLYENTFKTRNTAWADSLTSAPITFPDGTTATTKGWLFKVEAKDLFTGDVVTRSKIVGTHAANVDELVAALGPAYTDNLPEFTVTADNATGTITIAAKPGYRVRLHPQSSAGAFGMAGAVWTDHPVTAVNGTAFAGRADWVAYLDRQNDPAAVGIGIDPVAVIASINGIVPDANGTPIEVEVGQPVTLAADTTVNTAGTFTYSWISSDAAGEVLPGATVSKTFSTVGTWLVTLKVTDEEGKLSQVSQKVSAVAPAPAADISYVGTASGVQTIRFANLPAHTMLYIFWGDGLKSRVYDTTSPKDVDHDFRLYAKYDKGDHYEFKVTAYVYDGSTRVDVKQAVISIPKADNP